MMNGSVGDFYRFSQVWGELSRGGPFFRSNGWKREKEKKKKSKIHSIQLKSSTVVIEIFYEYDICIHKIFFYFIFHYHYCTKFILKIKDLDTFSIVKKEKKEISEVCSMNWCCSTVYCCYLFWGIFYMFVEQRKKFIKIYVDDDGKFCCQLASLFLYKNLVVYKRTKK